MRTVQGHQAQGRLGHPLRQQRRGARQQAGRADRHAHLRTGAARTARQEPHEDHLARAGGAVMAAKIKKGDSVDRARRQGQGPHRQGDRGAARGRAARWCAASTWSSATASQTGAARRAASCPRKRRSTSPTSRSPIPRTASRPASASRSSTKARRKVRVAKSSGDVDRWLTRKTTRPPARARKADKPEAGRSADKAARADKAEQGREGRQGRRRPKRAARSRRPSGRSRRSPPRLRTHSTTRSCAEAAAKSSATRTRCRSRRSTRS